MKNKSKTVDEFYFEMKKAQLKKLDPKLILQQEKYNKKLCDLLDEISDWSKKNQVTFYINDPKNRLPPIRCQNFSEPFSYEEIEELDNGDNDNEELIEKIENLQCWLSKEFNIDVGDDGWQCNYWTSSSLIC